MDPFGTSMPLVSNSAPSAYRFWECTTLLVQTTPHTCTAREKVLALKTLIAGDFPGLYSAFGELDATHTQLIEAGQAFFCGLYGQQQGTTMSEARYHIYTQKAGKLLKTMSLPLTDKNLFLQILCTHLQTIFAKSADQQAPSELDIT